MYSLKSFGKFWQRKKTYLDLSLCSLHVFIHFWFSYLSKICCRYAIFSSSISFWLPSIGIVYFYIEVGSIQEKGGHLFLALIDYWLTSHELPWKGLWKPIVNSSAYIDFKSSINAQNSSMMRMIFEDGWMIKDNYKKLKSQKMRVGNERLQSFSICPQSFIKRHFFIWLFFILSSIQSYLYFPTANSGSFDMQNLFSFNVQKSNNTEYSLPFIVPTIETVNSENVTLWWGILF